MFCKSNQLFDYFVHKTFIKNLRLFHLNERIIELTEISPNDLFGTQNSNVEILRKYFPKLKIVARGTNLKAYGEPDILDEFEKRLEMLIAYFNRYNKLDENSVERLLTSNGVEPKISVMADGVLVHGVNGKLIKAQTSNQRKMVESMQKNDMLFAVGPAGTGKTYTAVALAVKALKEKEAWPVKRSVKNRAGGKGARKTIPVDIKPLVTDITGELCPVSEQDRGRLLFTTSMKDGKLAKPKEIIQLLELDPMETLVIKTHSFIKE